MTKYRLENWAVGTDNPYNPPEAQRIFLAGEVYNHPSHIDGRKISTSYIDKVDGNVITTKSGSVYVLGEPEKQFVEYCEKAGCHVPTKEVPIKVHKNDN